MKGMPNEIRGTMTGIYTLFGTLGCLIFTIVGGNVYDKVGAQAPFTMLAIMDSVMLVIVLTLIILGKIKSTE